MEVITAGAQDELMQSLDYKLKTNSVCSAQNRQLILGSGGDYLHASFFTRILTCTAKENYSSSVYINIDTGRIAFLWHKTVQKLLV